MKAIFLPLLLIVSLSACAGPIETRVSSIGESGLKAEPFMWADSGDNLSPEIAEAKRLIGQRLASLGFAAQQPGPTHVEVTLSIRPANLALLTSDGVVLSPAKRRKAFQSCADNEYRLGVSITRIADGKLLYQGSASEYHCKQTLAEVLPILANAATMDIGNPKGSYILKR